MIVIKNLQQKNLSFVLEEFFVLNQVAGWVYWQIQNVKELLVKVVVGLVD